MVHQSLELVQLEEQDFSFLFTFEMNTQNMSNQSTSHIFMVYPTNFGFNPETSSSNHFQQKGEFDGSLLKKAQYEFNNAVDLLRSKEIDVTVFIDSADPIKPDAVFPNNWISIHKEGYVLYPMEAENRRTERAPEIIKALEDQFNIGCLLDLSKNELEGHYLEGTGSIIFDHVHKKAYASTSSRTDIQVLNELCAKLGYQPITFPTDDGKGNAIYHTNVLLAIGTGYAILCEDSISSEDKKNEVISSFNDDGIEVIPISIDQMYAFAGNMIELVSPKGERFLIMSQTAYNSLHSDQIERIERYTIPLPIPVETIEKFGGGSIRCMIAEVFF